LARGHTGPVLDTAWSPFDDNLVVSGSEDGKSKLHSSSRFWIKLIMKSVSGRFRILYSKDGEKMDGSPRISVLMGS